MKCITSWLVAVNLPSIKARLDSAVERLASETARLTFAPPVAHVYRPLEYAREAHALYVDRYAGCGAKVLLLGMNPGPFGMCQTGIPFGDVVLVRDWLGIDSGVSVPSVEHPARPILGFESMRREVSGTRLWGWAAHKFSSPEVFFSAFFVWNYCPLAFLEPSGRNRTPDKLPKSERETLFAACDAALATIIDVLCIRLVVGVGRFAGKRARAARLGNEVRVDDAPHPSPASPAANRDWSASFEAALIRAGVMLNTSV